MPDRKPKKPTMTVETMLVTRSIRSSLLWMLPTPGRRERRAAGRDVSEASIGVGGASVLMSHCPAVVRPCTYGMCIACSFPVDIRFP